MPAATVSTPFSGARGCIADVAALAQGIPLFPVERTMHLANVAEAREAAEPRVGWAAVFIKAYALVAREMPILRTWLAGTVHRRLVTADESVATLAVNRVEDSADHLYFARLARPESRPLTEIQRFIDDCATKPAADIFKRQRELELTPGPLRRAILRWNMRSASAKRTSRIGTFSLSTLAGMGATNRLHPTLCTTSLSYAPLDADGRCVVTLIADHRVLDGAAAARALQWLEQALATDVLDELRGTPAEITAAEPAPRAAA